MTGIERLRMLAEGTKNVALMNVIDYLETRIDMYDKYLNEEKTPDQMWDYITKKAKEQAINNCAVISDKVVYVWAISYFLATNEALGLKENKSSNTEKSKQNKVKSENSTTSEKQTNNVVDINSVKKENQVSLFKED